MLEVPALLAPLIVATFMSARRPELRLPWFLVAGYAYPLLLLSGLSDEGFGIPGLLISPEAANVGRVGVHALATLGLLFFVGRTGVLRPDRALLWAILTIAGMLISVFLAGSGFSAAARVLLTLFPVLNLFVLVPSVAHRESFFRGLAVCSVITALLCIALSVLVIARHGFFPVWSVRLGRPFGSVVLSYFLVSAFGLALLFRGRLLVKVILGAAVVASASRLDVALVVLAVIWTLLYAGSRRSLLALSVIVVLAAGGLYWEGLVREGPFLGGIFERTGFGSGRGRLWAEGWELILQKPLLGEGDRAYLERLGGPIARQEQRVHNMPLEMAMSYGIPTALLSMLVYLSLFAGVWRASRRRVVDRATVALGYWALLLAVSHSMLTTATWVNLGDGPGTLLLMFLVPLASRAYWTSKQDEGPAHRAHEPVDGPVSRGVILAIGRVGDA